MGRLALGAILLLAVLLVVQALLIGSEPLAEAHSNMVRKIPALVPPPKLPDITQFKVLRGKSAYWRIGQSNNGVWWLVSPENQAQFMNMVTTVQPFQEARDAGGIHFVSRDFRGRVDDGASANLDQWASSTLARVRQTGFKGLGAWSHPIFHQLDVPITRDLNLWTWMKSDCRRFYSPGWNETAARAVELQVIPLRENRQLIGYFIDNELDWGDAVAGPANYFNHLAPQDPNRAEVVKIIQSIWPSIESFNADWQTDLNDYVDLDSWETLPQEQTEAYGRLFTAWLSHLAEDYFRTTTQLIRQHDPNHLILGVRFRGYAPREVVRASRDFTDAQSINYYASDALLDSDMFQMMHRESGQPILVTEYSFHALDGRSGNRNTVGFAAQVLDQQARADAYRLFTQRLARVPFIIGGDWFQWSDEPPSGRSHDGEDVNFGVVDIDDHPYELLADAVRQTTPTLNPLHLASTTQGEQTEIWRENFSQKPSMRVPYLTSSIILNGELSDWPQTCKLLGIRHSQTVGLERSQLPLPNIYMGWTEQGLFMGIEVFDNDIQGIPPKGWWWTRDHVEFWISTRPVSPEQNRFDRYSHQFFFVPNDWPAEDGLLGVVGQWHRDGDALKEHLIPHPQIKQAARIRPDRYIVELFIPAAALDGFDSKDFPQLAFNIHIRNFQQATDYFWSSPKEVMTQLRPNTWGAISLEPPGGSNIAQTESNPAEGN